MGPPLGEHAAAFFVAEGREDVVGIVVDGAAIVAVAADEEVGAAEADDAFPGGPRPSKEGAARRDAVGSDGPSAQLADVRPLGLVFCFEDLQGERGEFGVDRLEFDDFASFDPAGRLEDLARRGLPEAVHGGIRQLQPAVPRDRRPVADIPQNHSQRLDLVAALRREGRLFHPDARRNNSFRRRRAPQRRLQRRRKQRVFTFHPWVAKSAARDSRGSDVAVDGVEESKEVQGVF
mmetsp:Transcript_30239/g.97501  ORF Transcript_30239/g.97501 Transcript_30239/m.97501 type:complete len:234 (+) Transcript_30239:343-1044(+)